MNAPTFDQLNRSGLAMLAEQMDADRRELEAALSGALTTASSHYDALLSKAIENTRRAA